MDFNVRFSFKFAGWGTDEKSIIAILGHRNVHQRQQIRKAYEELFKEDLVKFLEKEHSGDFEVKFHILKKIIFLKLFYLIIFIILQLLLKFTYNDEFGKWVN